MNSLFPASASTKDQLQSRLLSLAALYLFLFALILTLSPAVRLHSWKVDYRWTHWLGFAVWLASFMFLHRQIIRQLPDRDAYLLPIMALLSGWGLLTIWRLDISFGWRQTLWLALSTLVVWGGLRLPEILTLLRRYKYLWLTGGLLLTALTFLFGTYPGGDGPRLWLGCCGIYLQPSEPLKLLLIVYLAAYFADQLPGHFNLLQILMPTLILTSAALVILLAQRDLGTASLFLLLYFTIIYLASGRWRILGIGAVSTLAAGIIGYLLFDVIRLRVDAWINPWLEPSGRSFQIVQSLIAVAAGGVFGSGPGLGSPGVVPIAHSDFIFAAITEETGMVGALAIVILIALLASRGLLISLRATTTYQRYLAAGLTMYFALQSILIIGGNLRLVPLTGVTLPFVSYGGSSLLTSFFTAFLLLLISNQYDQETLPLPNPLPYHFTANALLASLALISLAVGWWATIRSFNLQSRLDNPRRTITSLYVPRGTLLDRRNQPIALTTGEAGQFSRTVTYPALGPVVGYTNSIYGHAGLEAALDDYLRGLQGNPASQIWWYELVYSQHPPGLDVRLSLDLQLQKTADDLLGDRRGAIVLLNASNGEILALASHPFFDPNQLNTRWSEWVQDQNAPFLNRTTLGQYPIGTALTPFLYTIVSSSRSDLPPLPDTLSLLFQGKQWQCAQPTAGSSSWALAISSGCPGAAITLGSQLTENQLYALYHSLGFLEAPDLPLPVAQPQPIERFQDPQAAALGQAEVSVTPLQVALAAAAISNNGNRPAPLLAMAIRTPHQGWVILPSQPAEPSLPEKSIGQITQLLADPNLPIWQSLGSAQTPKGQITWYLGGTRPGWTGAPLAMALVLEEDNPALAKEIGQALFKATLQP